MCLYNYPFRKLVKFFVIFSLLAMDRMHSQCCDQNQVSSLQVGVNYTRVNLKVDDQSTFSGNLGGIEGCYEYYPYNGIYGGLKIDWKQGKTKNSSADRKLNYLDVQERIGYTFTPYCDVWSLTLFSGFGYRYLSHKLKQSSEDSIKFDYNEFYVPVGLLSKYSFNACWSLGINCVWMPQVFPTVEIHPLKGAHWDLKNTLGNVLIELPLTYYRDCYSFVIKPFYERWEDGKSTAKTSNGQQLGLPKNSYNFYGVTVDLSYLF